MGVQFDQFGRSRGDNILREHGNRQSPFDEFGRTRGQNIDEQKRVLNEASANLGNTNDQLSLVEATLKEWAKGSPEELSIKSIQELSEAVKQILYQTEEATGHLSRAKELADCLLVDLSQPNSLNDAVKDVFENASVKSTDRLPNWWRNRQVTTYGQLVCYAKEELRFLKNIGTLKIEKMEAHLKEVGLQFRQD